MAYVFYESGLSINVMYTLEDAGKRAVGFKLSDGMDVPDRARVAVQVRAAEVEAGRDDPRLLLRHQGRVLSAPPSPCGNPLRDGIHRAVEPHGRGRPRRATLSVS